MKEELEQQKYLFLSIFPDFARLILTGEKTVELRKRCPKISCGDIVILYASSPICAIVGTATVRDIVEGSPNAIWRKVGKDTKVSKASFDAYYQLSENAVAIRLNNPFTLKSPISLLKLRSLLKFSPPQSYRYISPVEAKRLGI